MADLMIVATIALVLLLVSGLPIFLVFLSVNAAIVLFQIGPSGYGMFVNSMLNTATTQALATIPLFILMGEVIFRAGAVERLFRSIQLVVGFIPGRQNVVTMLLAAVLSALCSSNRPMEKAVVCFLTLRSQHKAIAKRNGKLSREVSVFQLPMYFVLLRLAQVR